MLTGVVVDYAFLSRYKKPTQDNLVIVVNPIYHWNLSKTKLLRLLPQTALCHDQNWSIRPDDAKQQ